MALRLGIADIMELTATDIDKVKTGKSVPSHIFNENLIVDINPDVFLQLGDLFDESQQNYFEKTASNIPQDIRFSSRSNNIYLFYKSHGQSTKFLGSYRQGPDQQQGRLSQRYYFKNSFLFIIPTLTLSQAVVNKGSDPRVANMITIADGNDDLLYYLSLMPDQSNGFDLHEHYFFTDVNVSGPVLLIDFMKYYRKACFLVEHATYGDPMVAEDCEKKFDVPTGNFMVLSPTSGYVAFDMLLELQK